ncbi:nucleotidyltransferase family protein [Photorhabdus tasmaniensis]|uniref:nucleotidyltransferase family protein n=1 Tax=Photorhabdus tasmaniensis TaxID=1004159 RepID=UPI004041E654
MSKSNIYRNLETTTNLLNFYVDNEANVNYSAIVYADLLFLGKHKLLPIWFSSIKKIGDIHKIGRHVFFMLSSYIDYIEHENNIRTEELARLCKLFNQNGMRYAIRKGYALSCYYEDEFHRPSSDIDLLVNPKDEKLFLSMLSELGYVNGLYDHYKRNAIKHSRYDLIKYKISPDHSPHQLKVISGVPIIIDFAFTSCWGSHPQEKEYQLDTATVFTRGDITYLSGRSLEIDAGFHLYRESRFISSLKNRPPYLLSYLDLILIDQKSSISYFDSISKLSEVYKEITLIQKSKIDHLLNQKVMLEDSTNKTTFQLFRYIGETSKDKAKEMLL